MPSPYEYKTEDPFFSELSSEIIRLANKGQSRIDFLKNISPLVGRIAGLPEYEIWIREDGLHFRWYYHAQEGPKIIFNKLTSISDSLFCDRESCKEPTAIERLYHQFFTGGVVFPVGFNKTGGPLHIPDVPLFFGQNNIRYDGPCETLLLVKFIIDSPNLGLLAFIARKKNAFDAGTINRLRSTAELVGVALSARHSHFALKERLKELTCLYEIAQIGANPRLSIEQMLKKVVDIFPAAWQYPDRAETKIEFDGSAYNTPGYENSAVTISRELKILGQVSGLVTVVYHTFNSEIGEDPFLPEEENFINTAASQLSTLLERRISLREKVKLQEQLRHADRLATIGQLAAGVAHELNEPLVAILGFAQLIEGEKELPEQTRQDVMRIIKASLHARDVIKKLLIFARKLPQNNNFVQVNAIIENDLYFLESRCIKQGVRLVREPGDVPEIWADESQMHQVIINLTVNAIQAMRDGGTLTISTKKQDGYILLSVKDTGMGMDEEVKKNLFLPFFTTKNPGEGTGIGLSVVHGIIEDMKGRIEIESEPGRGSVFNVYLPTERT